LSDYTQYTTDRRRVYLIRQIETQMKVIQSSRQIDSNAG